MAFHTANHTIRTVAGRVRHVLLPSRRALAVEMAIEIASLLAGLSVAGHVAVAICAHLAVTFAERYRR